MGDKVTQPRHTGWMGKSPTTRQKIGWVTGHPTGRYQTKGKATRKSPMDGRRSGPAEEELDGKVRLPQVMTEVKHKSLGGSA